MKARSLTQLNNLLLAIETSISKARALLNAKAAQGTTAPAAAGEKAP